MSRKGILEPQPLDAGITPSSRVKYKGYLMNYFLNPMKKIMLSICLPIKNQFILCVTRRMSLSKSIYNSTIFSVQLFTNKF
jgi:hypothetical protein